MTLSAALPAETVGTSASRISDTTNVGMYKTGFAHTHESGNV